MKAVKYFIRTTLYLFIVPAILSNAVALVSVTVMGFFVSGKQIEELYPWLTIITLLAAILAALSVTPTFTNSWFCKRFQNENPPQNFLVRYLPFYIPLIFWLAMALLGRLAHLDGEPLVFDNSFWLVVPTHCLYLLWILPMAFIPQQEFLLIYSLPLILSLVIAAICTNNTKKLAVTPSTGKKYGISILVLMILLPITLYIIGDTIHYRDVLRPDNRIAKVIDEPLRDGYRKDEPDLSVYAPFAKENNRLVLVDKPTLSISENHPRIGGALAFYPIYAAAVQAIYKNFDAEKQFQTHVMVGTSPETFSQLRQGSVDMVFMLEPSEQQQTEARRGGTRLYLTKVGREAFVFFVNSNNPIDGLSSEQIRDVYTRKITNWRELGGRNEKIMPFQRPEGSGSQTAMIRMMQGRPLTTPIHEESRRSMGGIINSVADYRNYENSIGYSFRFFAESMFQTDGIKLLTIDGIEPTVENIRNGSYPFVYDFYIITNGPPNGKTQLLVDWFLSQQGQQLIEQTGYVPVR